MSSSDNDDEDDKKRYDEEHVEERVDDPRPVDVLCGRGGMSNHHPGNEWYRRLIRSNRPLYRACPKHTKLLVAKAIVQAVEQQNGRFLERDKKTLHWYTISYKRAVDKTSQGLREKDRDLDFVDDAKKEAYKKREFASGLTGKASKAPTLADMTKGVIVRAESSQFTSSRRNGRTKGPTSRISMDQGQPKSDSLSRSAASETGLQRTTTTDDLTPLPPTMQVRQSSMLRNLQGTNLLPANKSQTVLSIRPNKSQGQQQLRPVLPKAATTGPATSSDPSAKQAIVNSSQTPSMHARAPVPNVNMVPVMVPYGTPAQWGMPEPKLQEQAPELTRFTSQVSDWLNSFWPMNGGSTNLSQPKQSAPHIATFDEQPSAEAIAAVAGRPLPRPHPSSVEEENGPSNPAARESSDKPARKLNKRKSGAMPPLPYAGVPSDNDNVARYQLSSELEQSVSVTLLQLASSPTKLFSGLTSYFADDLDSETVMHNKKRRTEDDDSSSKSKRARKRDSLLEDYEETPMEARLRLVQYS